MPDQPTPAQQMTEAITHMALYAGWPNAMTAITTLRNVIKQIEQ
jgi:4-carboxymuconolactone decarboxylase